RAVVRPWHGSLTVAAARRLSGPRERERPRCVVHAPVGETVPTHDVLVDDTSLERRRPRSIEQADVVLEQRLPLGAAPCRLEGLTVVEPAVHASVVGPVAVGWRLDPVVLNVPLDAGNFERELAVRGSPCAAHLFRIELRPELDQPNALVHLHLLPAAVRRRVANQRWRALIGERWGGS